MAEIFSKIKAIVKGPQGELFTKIVDSFYEQVGDECFSPEDLADIQSGLDEIKRGEHFAWEDCKSKHGL
ncbi:MAG: hypothetical protein A2139_01680 [Desulfobacca sp. RBG_16_60_12]|nr:MAG: hypothetical protein A2139_01680 [Desulfobacca sp. RBG_16_60_12]